MRLLTTSPLQLPMVLKGCKDAGLFPCITGAPGSGKSAMVEQMVAATRTSRDVPFGFQLNLLAQKDPAESRGLGFPDRKTNTTMYFMPRDCPFEGNEFMPDEGVRFNDEADRVQDLAMVNDMLTQLSARKVGDVPLKKGWWDVFACNGVTDIGTLELPDAFRTRVIHIYLHHDSTRYVVKHGRDTGWSATVLEYMRDHDSELVQRQPDWVDNALCYDAEGKVQPPNPRQWNRVSDIELACKASPGMIPVEPQLIQGAIGFMWMIKYLSWRYARDGITTLREIESSPSSAKIPVDRSALIATITQLAFPSEDMRIDARVEYMSRVTGVIQSKELAAVGWRLLGSLSPSVFSTAEYCDARRVLGL